MAKRARVPQEVQTAVLIECLRRCALCFALNGRAGIREGQIAHADRDSSNNDPKNLVWLCLSHHNAYDRRPAQAKGYTQAELLAHRAALIDYLATLPAAWADSSRAIVKRRARRIALSPEVYERKIQIYRAVRGLILKASQKATIEWPELFEFNTATDEAIFLFGSDVDEYLKELHRKSIELHTTREELRIPGFGARPGEDRQETVRMNTNAMKWFTSQLDVARELFSRYIYL